jgi:hypothetical protein
MRKHGNTRHSTAAVKHYHNESCIHGRLYFSCFVMVKMYTLLIYLVKQNYCDFKTKQIYQLPSPYARCQRCVLLEDVQP